MQPQGVVLQHMLQIAAALQVPPQRLLVRQNACCQPWMQHTHEVHRKSLSVVAQNAFVRNLSVSVCRKLCTQRPDPIRVVLGRISNVIAAHLLGIEWERRRVHELLILRDVQRRRRGRAAGGTPAPPLRKLLTCQQAESSVCVCVHTLSTTLLFQETVHPLLPGCMTS